MTYIPSLFSWQFDITHSDAMNLGHVYLKHTSVLVFLGAVCALEVPYVGVGLHVPLHYALVCEFSLAKVTLESLIARVTTHVAVVVRFDWEVFITNRAEMLPLMRVSVYHQFVRSEYNKNLLMKSRQETTSQLK